MNGGLLETPMTDILWTDLSVNTFANLISTKQLLLTEEIVQQLVRCLENQASRLSESLKFSSLLFNLVVKQGKLVGI